MVNYAFISDIHGNEEALRTVLLDIDKQKPKIEIILSLGDIVGYGAKSRECVSLFKERNIVSIAGNHDYAVSQTSAMDLYDEDSQRFFEATAKQLSDNELDYLRGLPLLMNLPEFTLAHSSPQKPEKFDYVRGPLDAFDQVFSKLSQEEVTAKSPNAKIFFIGHTHSPCYYSLRKDITNSNRDHVNSSHAYGDLVVYLQEGEHYLINCGSVGQPRDRDSRSCYVTFDSEKKVLQFHRVKYNIEKAQKQILRAGIQPHFAQRLEYGF